MEHGYLRVILSLIFVLGIIGIISLLAKRVFYAKQPRGKGKLLKIEEILYIDPKRKIITVRNKSKKYILLLGQHDQLLDVVQDENPS